jgi:hypothetical protein
MTEVPTFIIGCLVFIVIGVPIAIGHSIRSYVKEYGWWMLWEEVWPALLFIGFCGLSLAGIWLLGWLVKKVFF